MPIGMACDGADWAQAGKRGIQPEEAARMSGLVRPRRGRMIAGVCAGIGTRFGLPTTMVRVVFVLSCVLSGPQVLLYAALWAIMPSE